MLAQSPLSAIGVNFGAGNKQPLEILKHMSGVLRPVRLSL